DRNRSHWSTSKTPSYTKSVSWQHHPRIHDHDRWGDILSSGEKQRIALARLILRRPKWIFLDETTSHLEEQEAIRLLRLVREKLPTSGVIMVTHQPGVWNLADDICDISAVL
ncbi:ATP-binding cassette domain-containing protein, partial [Escherichia coli]